MKRLLLASLFCVACVNVLFAQAIIVDHTSTDIDALGDSAIAAGAKVRSVMRHASILGHVGAYRGSGLHLLAAENARYNHKSFKFVGRGHPGSEAVIDDFLIDDLKSDEPGGFVKHTEELYDVYGTYLYHNERWKDKTPNWPYYRDAMNKCEAAFPNKTFVWTTTSIGAKFHPTISPPVLTALDAYNAAVRDYCRKNNKILYDIADIECHDPAGNKVLLHGFECLCSDYTTDRIHANTPLGKKQLAKGYWALMVKIAERDARKKASGR